MLLTTAGGGLGLVCFGPLAERLGRRGAFFFFQAAFCGTATTIVSGAVA